MADLATADLDAAMPGAQETTGNVTADTFNRLRSTYGLSITETIFVTLCAYLNSLLVWGLEAVDEDLDRFIVCYSTFETTLPQLYRQAADERRDWIASYHWWLDNPENVERCAQEFDAEKTRQGGPVLTESRLRAIWSEHPFRFLWVKMSMQRIVHDRL